MIEHIHINQIPSFIRLKRKEHFTIKHVQKLLQQIKKVPSLAKVQAALKKHGSISSIDTDVGVDDGLTEDEISALGRLNKSLELLEERLEKDFEVARENYRNDKRKSMEMKSLLLTLLEENVPLMLVEIMGRVCFESRKRISEICIILLRPGDSELCQIMSRYLDRSATTLIRMLTYLCECDNIVLLCGNILRKSFSHSIMVAECLTEDMFFFKKFFSKFMQSETFDVVSDAHFTVKTLMFSDTDLVAEYLEIHGDEFAKLFNEELLGSAHYVTQRLGLELLHDLLFERKNYKFMIRYVNKKENLILVMMRLRDSSTALRNDALHVFKVFVANPNKSEEIERILRMNRKKLLEFLRATDLTELSPEDKKQMFNYLESCCEHEANEEKNCHYEETEHCAASVVIIDPQQTLETKAAS